MSAPYSNLASKLEQAAVAYATPLLPDGTNFTTGQSATVKVPPLIVCAADLETAEEEPQFTGNYWLDFSVDVKVMAPTDADGVLQKPANDLLVAQTFDAFSSTSLAAQLSAAGTDFTCFAMLPRGPNFRIEGDAWINTLNFRAYCCASTL